MRPTREDRRLIEIRRKLARLGTSDAFNLPIRRDALITLERIMTRRVEERLQSDAVDAAAHGGTRPAKRGAGCLRP